MQLLPRAPCNPLLPACGQPGGTHPHPLPHVCPAVQRPEPWGKVVLLQLLGSKQALYKAIKMSEAHPSIASYYGLGEPETVGLRMLFCLEAFPASGGSLGFLLTGLYLSLQVSPD